MSLSVFHDTMGPSGCAEETLFYPDQSLPFMTHLPLVRVLMMKIQTLLYCRH